HRVRHLAAAPVEVDLAEERGFGALPQLLGAPRLVEEGAPQVPAAVADLDLDQRPAVAGAPRRHPLPRAEPQCFLAASQAGDLGLVGPVDVPAGVVLEEIKHRLDLDLAEG